MLVEIIEYSFLIAIFSGLFASIFGEGLEGRIVTEGILPEWIITPFVWMCGGSIIVLLLTCIIYGITEVVYMINQVTKGE